MLMPAVGSSALGYTIVRKLRSGGMATLYLGKKLGVDGFVKHVAIKRIHPHFAENPSFRQMFIDEAVISSKINHPNVVQTLDFFEHDATYYLIMEYVRGCSLRQLLSSLAKLGERMEPRLAVRIIMRVAEGLHAAHESVSENGVALNVVHRDVSPDNIMITHSGHVKLIDFGVAKACDEVRRKQSASGTVKGKVGYMAPEHACGCDIDRRADIYALGVVLWEMLTMRRCLKGKNMLESRERAINPNIAPPHEVVPTVDPALSDVVMHALEIEPDDRPPTAREFRRELAGALPPVAGADVDETHIAELLERVLEDYDEIFAVPSGVTDVDTARESYDSIDLELFAVEGRPEDFNPEKTTDKYQVEEVEAVLKERFPDLSDNVYLDLDYQAHDSPEPGPTDSASERSVILEGAVFDEPPEPRVRIWVVVLVVVAVAVLMLGLVAALGSEPPPEETPALDATRKSSASSVPEPVPTAQVVELAASESPPSPEPSATTEEPLVFDLISRPAGAKVYRGNELLGETPLRYSMAEVSENLEVRLELAGYERVDVKLVAGGLDRTLRRLRRRQRPRTFVDGFLNPFEHEE